MKQAKTISIETVMSSFFKSQDWINRTLTIGGAGILMLVGFYALQFMLILFAVVPIIGVLAVVLFTVVALALAILLSGYAQGYKIEYAEAIQKNKEVSLVKVFASFRERFETGIRVSLANLIYSLPGVILIAIAYTVMIALVVVSEGSNEFTAAHAGVALIFYALLFAGLFLNFVVMAVFHPAILANYIKHRSFKRAVNFNEVWEFVLKHKMNLLIFVLVHVLGYIGMMVALFVSAISIFLCVGFLLVPLTYVLGIVYLFHLQPTAIGEMLKAE